jgi:3-oxoacyl-[acyl-carrier protein] reductase
VSTRADWYQELANGRLGGPLTKRLGLPRPGALRRYEPGQPLVEGPVLVGAAGTGRRLADHVHALVAASSGATAGTDGTDTTRLAAVVLDATGVTSVDDLAQAREFLTPAVRRLGPSARLLILAAPPEEADGVEAAAARQALEGLVRSVAKELRDGATANLVLVASDAEPTAADSTLRFLLSARSAYVDGQVIRVGPAGTRDAATTASDPPAPDPAAPDSTGPDSTGPDSMGPDSMGPHAGRVVVVTGAARGIGAAIAEVFARDGADVVCLDVPAQGEALAATANRIRGTALQLDITAPDAADRLTAHVRGRHGGLDVMVHNAGITRDKLLVNMDEKRWDAVLAVNLRAQLTLNAALIADNGPLRSGGRLVSVSSTSGIAGNRGQTNYAASKAGVIGMVRALAPSAGAKGVTVNAVAPGFIETEMTAAMPFGTREAGRRINSLHQGGRPVDVGETVAWLAEPTNGGVTGQVVRVCGQSLLGA